MSVDYDVSNADDDREYNHYGDQPEPGLWAAQIVRCERRTEKRDGTPTRDLEVTFSLGDERYAWVWHYPKLDSGQLAQLLRAVGINKPKGRFNTEDLIGKQVQLQIVATTFRGDYWAKVKSVLPPEKVERGDTEQPF